jgi:LacI family transcriptional regulator
VLNNKAHNIPQKTKDLVMRSSKKLRYRPNQVAIGLVLKRTKTIGLIISDVRNLFFATLAKGVEDECRRNGLNMILCNTNDIHHRDIEYINVLADKGVDGILYGMSSDMELSIAEEYCNAMKHMDIPFVMVDRYFENLQYPAVIVDHVLGGYLATRHLLDLGHTRIACITGPSHLDDSASRLKGYCKALEEAGVLYDDAIIYEGHYTVESGVSAVDYLLSKYFTAIFAFNDMAAYGALNTLIAHNIKVPDDVALVGYDDIFFSQLTTVPITTIHQPVYEIGIEATKRLLTMIDGTAGNDGAGRYTKFTPYLVVRKSSIAAAARQGLSFQ